jgi:hypothetical protein
MHAVNSSVFVDATHAPEILIFRLMRWPALVEQKTLLKTIVESRHLDFNSSAVLDISGVAHLPDPDSLAAALAQAASNRSTLKRVACVVASPEQAQFVETLRMMAPQPGRIAVFFAEDDAIGWLRNPH